MTEFHLATGSDLPLHDHPQEQTGYLVSGILRLTIAGEARELRPGDSWCIPGGVEHEAHTVQEAVAVEVSRLCARTTCRAPARDARAARGLPALALVVVLAAALATVKAGCGAGTGSAVHAGDAALGRAFDAQLSGLEVQDRGMVAPPSPGRRAGHRHQRSSCA